MCTTFAETSLPATKSSPTNSLHFTPTAPGRGILIVDQKGRGKIAEYSVAEFHADGGRGFHLTKREGGSDRTTDAYDVFIPCEETADAGFAHETCDCRGFQTAGHCKHIDAIRAITDRGLISLPTVTPMPATIALPAKKAVEQMTPAEIRESVRGKSHLDNADQDRW
jgi:hypothetical protein